MRFGGACTDLAFSLETLAGNGLLPTGLGVESQGLGGADAAISRDTSAINANPAGLAQIENQAVDIYLSPFFALRTEHCDGLGNSQRVDNKTGFIGGAGYARRLTPDTVLGLGSFVQGGTGFTYKDLNTGFGNRDELSAQFAVMKAAAALSWQPHPRWRLGAGLGLSYAAAKERVFPGTSDGGAPFFGYRLDGLHGMGLNGKLGVQYLASDLITIGLAYTSKTPLDMSDGTLTANYDSVGLGRVTYQKARLEGLAIGQQLELGAAWHPNPAWLICVEVEWIDWSQSMSSSSLYAANSRQAGAPAVFAFDSPLNWKDQYPMSIGVMYQLNPLTELRAGYSHAQNPTPGSTQNPVFAVIAENQIALSARRHLPARWTLNLGAEYQPYHKRSYDNPSLPVTADAAETNNYLWAHLMIGRCW